MLLPPAVVAGERAGAATGMPLPGSTFRSEEGWWALACRPACVLQPASLTVTAQPVVQCGGRTVPGQRVRVARASGAGTVLLFKTARSVLPAGLPRRGPVLSWYPAAGAEPTQPAGRLGTMEAGIPLPGGRVLQIIPTLLQPRTARSPADPGAPLGLDLAVAGKRQHLGVFDFGPGGPTGVSPADYLRWAGDLDGDGQPDVLVNLDFSGGESLALFLSSLASPGALVGLAGRFTVAAGDLGAC